MRTPAATAAKAASPPTAKIAEEVCSSELFVETSILGSIAQTLDFPSWSIDTPRSISSGFSAFLNNVAGLLGRLDTKFKVTETLSEM